MILFQIIVQIFNINSFKNEKNINFRFKDPLSNRSRDSKKNIIYYRNSKKKIKRGTSYTNEYLQEESQKNTKYNGNIFSIKR